MRVVAENLNLDEAAFRGFVINPEWKGTMRLHTGLTVADIQVIHEIATAGGCGEGAVDDYDPGTLSEARAMLAQLRAEHRELQGRLAKSRDALRKAAENLSSASTTLRSMIDHDERAVAALGDVVATFLPDDKGWARSVSVTMDDLNGWKSAARPWEGV